MDSIQEFLEIEMKRRRAHVMGTSSQLTLGKLIQLVDRLPEDGRAEEEIDVVFDFEYLFPTTLNSWRGAYEELALGFTADYLNSSSRLNLKEFKFMLKSAIGKTYTGYKGGEYQMNEDTPIWVANYGNSGSTGIIDVKDERYQVILITGLCEY